jgi:hypothetical protein
MPRLTDQFDEERWVTQELARATRASDADAYLAMGPEHTKSRHRRLAELIRDKFAGQVH